MPKRIVKDPDVGLKVIYNGVAPEIDIVAVHGIGAHREETWCARVEEPDGSSKWLNWLCDPTMLPAAMPQIRVLNFGYKSDWFGNVVHTSLAELAQLLWVTLLDQRKGCPERPLVFVTHCFGGLIVMTALTDPFERQMFESTTGLICLGTPFRGTHANFHHVLPQMVESNIENRVNKHILQYLEEKNPFVVTIRTNFFNQRRRVGKHELPMLVCISEGQESQVSPIVPRGQQTQRPHIEPFLVVSSVSAHLDSATNYTFQTDHFKLNKFESPDDVNFLYICKTLKEIRDVALIETVPSLRRLGHATSSSPALHEPRAQQEFCDQDWEETPQPEFNARISRKTAILHTQRSGWNKKFKPSGASISQDCKHMLLRHDKEVWILPLATVNDGDGKSGTSSYPLKIEMPPVSTSGDGRIQFANAGITISTFISNFDCWIFRFPQPISTAKDPEVLRIEHLSEGDRRMKCVAVWETPVPSPDTGGFVLIAIGIQKQQNRHDKGLIELWRIDRLNWNERIMVQSFKDLEDRVTQKTDSPKTLAFSKDGSVLVCTTKCNQVHAWRIPIRAAEEVHERPLTPFEKICEATRPFGAGVNAKGITSATAWLTSREHPYVLCTTVPCTERNLNGGEWTFMSPLSSPLPDAKTHHAFHCFLQLQNGRPGSHLHIYRAAISPKSNMVAFLTGTGKICLIRILPRTTGGGLRSCDEIPPIELGLKLGNVYKMCGDIRFSDDGTRLYAVTWKSSVEIIFERDDKDSLSSSGTPNEAQRFRFRLRLRLLKEYLRSFPCCW